MNKSLIIIIILSILLTIAIVLAIIFLYKNSSIKNKSAKYLSKAGVSESVIKSFYKKLKLGEAPLDDISK